MSECVVGCLGTGEGHGHITITRPRFVGYIVRARSHGQRRYEIICRTDSRDHAYQRLAEAMLNKRYKRGDVLADEGPDSYYEPSLLVEMVRR